MSLDDWHNAGVIKFAGAEPRPWKRLAAAGAALFGASVLAGWLASCGGLL